jgi:hypothetical protein
MCQTHTSSHKASTEIRMQGPQDKKKRLQLDCAFGSPERGASEKSDLQELGSLDHLPGVLIPGL